MALWTTALLCLSTCIIYVDNILFVSALPLLLQQQTLKHQSHLFLLHLSRHLPAIFLAPALGYYLDRRSRPTCCGVALVMSGVGIAVSGSANSVWVMVVGRLMTGAGEGAIVVAAGSIICDLYGGVRRRMCFGLLSVSAVSGSGLGYHLSLNVHTQADWTHLCWSSGGLCVLFALLFQFTTQEPKRGDLDGFHGGVSSVSSGWRGALSDSLTLTRSKSSLLTLGAGITVSFLAAGLWLVMPSEVTSLPKQHKEALNELMWLPFLNAGVGTLMTPVLLVVVPPHKRGAALSLQWWICSVLGGGGATIIYTISEHSSPFLPQCADWLSMPQALQIPVVMVCIQAACFGTVVRLLPYERLILPQRMLEDFQSAVSQQENELLLDYDK